MLLSIVWSHSLPRCHSTLSLSLQLMCVHNLDSSQVMNRDNNWLLLQSGLFNITQASKFLSMYFILPSKLFDWCPMMILLLTWIWMNQSCPPWSLRCSVSLSCLWSPLEHCCWWWSWRWWHNTVSNHQPVFTDNYQMIAQSMSQTSHKVSADSHNLLSSAWCNSVSRLKIYHWI